ncbi:MAG: class I SAM-dependent methyltransferase [Planctomycetes bacterium]|nr:class I SAM-dependent methyltransferase [Planctomycetota bacterium]
MTFEDGYFDIVTSINSLDHVDDLDKTISEIIRVTSKDGCFLLMVEVNHEPTKCEPISFSWDVVDKFLPKMKVVEKKCLEDVSKGIMFTNIKKNIKYDHSNAELRKGVLIARFMKAGKPLGNDGQYN